MRELLSAIAIAILLVVGWKQSFQSHWYQVIGKSTPGPAAKVHSADPRGTDLLRGIGPVNSPLQAPKENQ
jgi:hypothetical protein